MTRRAFLRQTMPKTKRKEKRAFDAQAFLDLAGVARKVVEYNSKVTLFTQGDPATSVLYIQKGGVKVTVVNEGGKEVVVAILGPGDFLGQGCLAGQLQRVSTAVTITRSTILAIEKGEMIRTLHAEQSLSDRFITYVLSRTFALKKI